MGEELLNRGRGEETTEEERPQPPQEVVDPRDPDPSPPGPNVEISAAREPREAPERDDES